MKARNSDRREQVGIRTKTRAIIRTDECLNKARKALLQLRKDAATDIREAEFPLLESIFTVHKVSRLRYDMSYLSSPDM